MTISNMKPKVELIDVDSNYEPTHWTTWFGLVAIAGIIALFFVNIILSV